MKSQAQIKERIAELEQKHARLESEGRTADANMVEHQITDLEEVYMDMHPGQLADADHLF